MSGLTHDQRYYQAHREEISQKRKKRYRRWKRLGLCTKCGKPPLKGRASCARHLSEAVRLALDRESVLRARGLCIRCQEPNKRRTARCLKCSLERSAKRKKQSKIESLRRWEKHGGQRSRGWQVEIVCSLLSKLMSGKYTVSELARAASISRRTVHRWLSVISLHFSLHDDTTLGQRQWERLYWIEKR